MQIQMRERAGLASASGKDETSSMRQCTEAGAKGLPPTKPSLEQLILQLDLSDQHSAVANAPALDPPQQQWTSTDKQLQGKDEHINIKQGKKKQHRKPIMGRHIQTRDWTELASASTDDETSSMPCCTGASAEGITSPEQLLDQILLNFALSEEQLAAVKAGALDLPQQQLTSTDKQLQGKDEHINRKKGKKKQHRKPIIGRNIQTRDWTELASASTDDETSSMPCCTGASAEGITSFEKLLDQILLNFALSEEQLAAVLACALELLQQQLTSIDKQLQGIVEHINRKKGSKRKHKNPIMGMQTQMSERTVLASASDEDGTSSMPRCTGAGAEGLPLPKPSLEQLIQQLVLSDHQSVAAIAPALDPPQQQLTSTDKQLQGKKKQHRKPIMGRHIQTRDWTELASASTDDETSSMPCCMGASAEGITSPEQLLDQILLNFALSEEQLAAVKACALDLPQQQLASTDKKLQGKDKHLNRIRGREIQHENPVMSPQNQMRKEKGLASASNEDETSSIPRSSGAGAEGLSRPEHKLEQLLQQLVLSDQQLTKANTPALDVPLQHLTSTDEQPQGMDGHFLQKTQERQHEIPVISQQYQMREEKGLASASIEDKTSSMPRSTVAAAEDLSHPEHKLEQLLVQLIKTKRELAAYNAPTLDAPQQQLKSTDKQLPGKDGHFNKKPDGDEDEMPYELPRGLPNTHEEFEAWVKENDIDPETQGGYDLVQHDLAKKPNEEKQDEEKNQ